ncbi:MAG: hypothetical protein ACRDIY_08015 [Chloroflexota bacterium]
MGRHFAPLWVPVGAVFCAAVLIYFLSRVLLSFNRETTPFVALAIALLILIVATYVASKFATAEETS